MDRLTGEEAVAAIERRVPRAARVGNLDIVAVELDMILAGDNDIREVCSAVILQQGDIVELEAGAGPVWVHLKMDILAVGVVNELDEVVEIQAIGNRIAQRLGATRSSEKGVVEGRRTRTEVKDAERGEVDGILCPAGGEMIVGDERRRRRVAVA